jgi:hypothetical protein
MIVLNLKGGLGNQMFQYALGLALSTKLSVPLKLDLRDLKDRTPRGRNFVFRTYDLDIFGIAPNQPTVEELWRFGMGMRDRRLRELWLRALRFLPLGFSVYAERTFAYDEHVLNLGPSVYLDGYWQTEKYFSNIACAIRELFTVSTPRSPEIANLHEVISSGQTVCLNVRRGDFVNHPLHQTTDPTYFERAVHEMKSRLDSDFRVFIFSDDVDWCRQNLHLAADQTIVEHRFAGERFSQYLSLMSHCKHFIIPNSSFAWWAAWLSNNPRKVVIAPRKWFADPRIDTKDILPTGWVAI